MPTLLTTEAIEESTYVIRASLIGEAGTAVVPNSGLTWKLTDVVGTVVNSRSAVAISSASSITIVLHGDDLALADTFRDNRRLVTLSGTYNSSVGSNLEIRDHVQFTITNLGAIT